MPATVFGQSYCPLLVVVRREGQKTVSFGTTTTVTVLEAFPWVDSTRHCQSPEWSRDSCCGTACTSMVSPDRCHSVTVIVSESETGLPCLYQPTFTGSSP